MTNNKLFKPRNNTATPAQLVNTSTQKLKAAEREVSRMQNWLSNRGYDRLGSNRLTNLIEGFDKQVKDAINSHISLYQKCLGECHDYLTGELGEVTPQEVRATEREIVELEKSIDRLKALL